MVKQNLVRINTDNYFVGVSFSDFQRLQEQDKIKLVANWMFGKINVLIRNFSLYFSFNCCLWI